MKTTKLYPGLLVLLAILTISFNGYAQEKEMKKTPEEKAKLTSERLKASLNLSEDQTAKVYELNLQKIKDHKEFIESKEKLNSDMKKKNSEYKNSLSTILTEEQMKSMKEMHKERKFRKGHRNKMNRNR